MITSLGVKIYIAKIVVCLQLRVNTFKDMIELKTKFDTKSRSLSSSMKLRQYSMPLKETQSKEKKHAPFSCWVLNLFFWLHRKYLTHKNMFLFRPV